MGFNVQLFIVGTVLCGVSVGVVLGFIRWRIRQQTLEAIARGPTPTPPWMMAPQHPAPVTPPQGKPSRDMLATPIRPSAVERIFEVPSIIPSSVIMRRTDGPIHEFEHDTPAVLMIGPGPQAMDAVIVHTPDEPRPTDHHTPVCGPALADLLRTKVRDQDDPEAPSAPAAPRDPPTLTIRDTMETPLDQLPTPLAFPASRDP